LIGLHSGMALADVFDLGLFLATVLIWFVGLYDDIRGLSPVARLTAAGVAGGILVVLAKDTQTGLSPFVWVLVVIVVVNAVNLLDGLDLLAGTASAMVGVGLAVFAMTQGWFVWWAVLPLVGALLGFLVWNYPPARLYLGDNGAYVVGVALAWGAMSAGVDGASSLVAIALLGVPVFDMAITVGRRLVAKVALFSGDRDHTYDRLHRVGWSALRIAVVFAGFQAVWSLGLIAISANVGDRPALITAAVVGVLVVAAGVLTSSRRQRAD
jgi:UDP-GlcNAc:undecaprenyl-phosphate GlcNAc-1-phosphate transferase